MIKHQTKIRVRYAETDKMGYCYYGNYPQYYEVGRTELVRHIGFPYDKMEKNGILLPVVSLKINYRKPAFYDDELTIVTYIKNMPSLKIVFNYEVYNQNEELLNTGETTLVFVDAETRKPMRFPDELAEIFGKYFNK